MNDRPKLRVLDLFSGIGGFSLGLELTGGFETVAFCEIEEYPRRVLAKHWPGVPIYEDVRTLTADTLSRDGIAVDVICGGFPCQDISLAGAGAGIEGARSGLWGEYARLIGELRPRFVIVENVAALLGRGLGRVLGDLAALGYDAQWDCIPASAIGAPHRRDRVWIVAYAEHVRCDEQEHASWLLRSSEAARLGTVKSMRSERRRPDVADTSCVLFDGIGHSGPPRWAEPSDGRWWLVEPDVGRVAHGVPSRVDRLKGLGNAVVPQIPEMIGRAILEAAE